MKYETPSSVSMFDPGTLPGTLPCEFAMQFIATPRGAQQARRLAAHRLDIWGIGSMTPAHDAVALIVGELAANAVRHGYVPGRDFLLRLVAERSVIRVEVSDCRAERRPSAVLQPTAPDAESGRGLQLVAALATRWAVADRVEGPGKTIWAEVEVEVR